MICATETQIEYRPWLWLSPIRGFLYLFFQKCAKLAKVCETGLFGFSLTGILSE